MTSLTGGRRRTFRLDLRFALGPVDRRLRAPFHFADGQCETALVQRVDDLAVGGIVCAQGLQIVAVFRELLASVGEPPLAQP